MIAARAGHTATMLPDGTMFPGTRITHFQPPLTFTIDRRAAGLKVVATAPFGGTTKGTAVTGAPTRYHVPVLMYHRIAPASERGRDLADLVLDPKVFDAQLAALEAHGWRTITSGQLAQAVTANEELPARTFVITLDDGREDGYTHAFPILQKHGFVATFFVITGRVNERRYLSWAQLSDMQAAGMEIGNHTVSHHDETRFTRSQTDRQVMGAQDAIERNLGVPAISFAYPSGRMPANLVASVMASGLEVAYTTVRGADETVATAYSWPRVRVHPTTTAAGILWLVNPYGQMSPEPARPRLDRRGVRTRSGEGLGYVDWWIVSAEGGEPRRLGARGGVAW